MHVRRPAVPALAPVGLLASVLLVGCGSEAPEVENPRALAVELACLETFEEVDPPPLAAEAGVCTLAELEERELDDAEELTLLTFPSEAAREEYVRSLLPEGKVFVVAHQWAIEVESEEAALAVNEAVGGESRLGDSADN